MTLDLTRPHKRVEFTIKISSNRQATINGGEEFFTMDSGGTAVGIFNFELEKENGEFKEIDLTDVEKVLIGFDFTVARSSVVLEPDEILDAENGRVALVLPNQFEYSGPVLGYTYIIWKDGREQDGGEFQLTFTESWLDKELPEMEDFYVKRFEDLANEIRRRVEEIKAEMDKELKAVKQDITTAQTDINRIQSQIDDNDIVRQEEFNNLASVGRNLLRNGRTPTLLDNSASNLSSRGAMTEDGIPFIRCTLTSGTRVSVYTTFPRTQIVEDLAGKTVELTHKIRANKECRSGPLGITLYGGTVTLSGHGTRPIANLSTDWQTVRHVVTIPKTYTFHTGLRFGVEGADNIEIGDWVDFRDWSISIVDDKWSLPIEDLRPTTAPLPLGSAPQIGTSGQFADANHVHQMPTASQVGALSNTGGTVSGNVTFDSDAILGNGVGVVTGNTKNLVVRGLPGNGMNTNAAVRIGRMTFNANWQTIAARLRFIGDENMFDANYAIFYRTNGTLGRSGWSVRCISSSNASGHTSLVLHEVSITETQRIVDVWFKYPIVYMARTRVIWETINGWYNQVDTTVQAISTLPTSGTSLVSNWIDSSPNTHTHTASQVGALPINGGAVTGPLMTRQLSVTSHNGASGDAQIDIGVAGDFFTRFFARVTENRTHFGIFDVDRGNTWLRYRGDHLTGRVYFENVDVAMNKTLSVTGNITAPRLIGNADTATRLQTPRLINGVAFDGSTNITITANPAHTLLANVDLDNIMDQGFYGGNSYSWANMPSGVTGWASLVVELRNPGGGKSGFQKLTLNNQREFIRSFSEGVFDSWIEVPTQVGDTVFNMRVERSNQLNTPRNITVGNSTKPFDGTTNVSYSLNEIGALASNANAVSATRLQTPRLINGVAFDGSTNINIQAQTAVFEIKDWNNLNAELIRYVPARDVVRVVSITGSLNGPGGHVYCQGQYTSLDNANGFLEVVAHANSHTFPTIKYYRRYGGGQWGDWFTDSHEKPIWFNLTPINGTAIHSPDSPPQYCKIGHVVHLRGAFTNILSRGTICATLPAGYRPVGQHHHFVQNTTVGNDITYFARWLVNHEDGTIELARINRIDGYVPGNWFPIHTSFVVG